MELHAKLFIRLLDVNRVRNPDHWLSLISNGDRSNNQSKVPCNSIRALAVVRRFQEGRSKII
ncbi:hypothetical protein [Salinisphaera sp. G21_0]|uniref:hypothetical protein n=1 Tax=Salinisphaera sp. G21_0 TaxID=2821094 RepID=UPI001ADABEC1|nr:hypothetical protein [Salinisphaera sp. G21_0]MBO9483604.1 hypothetical protein [Salinisphaera sp. G21_0]